MYRIKTGQSDTFYYGGLCYHIEIVSREGSQCTIRQTYEDAWGQTHTETYVSEIACDRREEYITTHIGDNGEIAASDFYDDCEYQRMGIDYSPSNPWDAPA